MSHEDMFLCFKKIESIVISGNFHKHANSKNDIYYLKNILHSLTQNFFAFFQF